jgi:hypothetical protein
MAQATYATPVVVANDNACVFISQLLQIPIDYEGAEALKLFLKLTICAAAGMSFSTRRVCKLIFLISETLEHPATTST